MIVGKRPDQTINILRESFINCWIPIEQYIVGAAGVASISFATIPQTYRSLVLVMSLRTDRAAEADAAIMQFNADTGANYDYEYIDANDTTVTADGVRAATSMIVGILDAANSTAGVFTQVVVWIPNYTDTNSYRQVSSMNSCKYGNLSADADLQMRSTSGKWRSQNAITSITIDQSVGPNFVQYSRAALYGIL